MMLQRELERTLSEFASNNPLRDQTAALFRSLGYSSDRTLNNKGSLLETIKSQGQEGFEPIDSLCKSIELVFQLSEADLAKPKQKAVSSSRYISLNILAVELKKEHCSRTELANITRAINKHFSTLTVISFKDRGGGLSISLIQRRESKKDSEADVLEKVTLLKDINIGGGRWHS